MNWTNIVEQLFELVVYPILGIAGTYLTYLISIKIKELKQKSSNDMATKYLDMLNDTITNAVVTTTQTYVESLKAQNKFDAEAQKKAFQITYDAVMRVLTADAIKYITSYVGDLETYVTNKIESAVVFYKA